MTEPITNELTVAIFFSQARYRDENRYSIWQIDPFGRPVGYWTVDSTWSQSTGAVDDVAVGARPVHVGVRDQGPQRRDDLPALRVLTLHLDVRGTVRAALPLRVQRALVAVLRLVAVAREGVVSVEVVEVLGLVIHHGTTPATG